jgi:hypothetical protein
VISKTEIEALGTEIADLDFFGSSAEHDMINLVAIMMLTTRDDFDAACGFAEKIEAAREAS